MSATVSFRRPGNHGHSVGFTLIEMLVTCAALLLILAFVFGTISSSSDTWTRATAKIEAFQGARTAFDLMTRRLGQATLNTRWDYDPPQTGSSPPPPARYVRKSDLHFITGPGLAGASQAVFFQTPAGRTQNPGTRSGLAGLLNACGFFLDYRADQIPPGLGLSANSRFRLFQWMPPTEKLSIFTQAGNEWFAQAATDTTNTVPIADNIIALILWPRLADNESPPADWMPSFSYDSRVPFSASEPQPTQSHQLPPIIELTMVAIDEASCRKMGAAMKSTIENAVSGLFGPLPSSVASNGEARTHIKEELAELESRLRKEKINFRVFSAAIPIQESKWTKN